MKSKRTPFTKVVNTSADKVDLSIESPTSSDVDVYGELTFNRLTAEFHVVWYHQCPISYADRLLIILWFVKFLISL